MQKPRKIPQRQCVGCREMKEKKSLLRIVRTPEGEVLLDDTGKKSGRGEGPQGRGEKGGAESSGRKSRKEIKATK